MQENVSPFANSENAVRFLSQREAPLTETETAQLYALLQSGPATWHTGVIARHLGDTALNQWLSDMHTIWRDYPLMLEEIALFPALSHQACFALAQAYGCYFHHDSDPALLLSEDTAYFPFAFHILKQAQAHLTAIHAGKIRYAADKAFAIEEAHLIARCARVAALRYDDATAPLISSLLTLTSFAPGDARTVPSQSLAIALGHAIQAYPLVETLETLMAVIRTIRHAGVKKKLERNLKPAQRALAERPELALEMSAQLKPGKKSTQLLATCLEAGYVQESRFDWESWREQLQNSSAGSNVAQKLIWLAEPPDGKPICFMPEKQGYCDAQGNKIPAPTGSIIRLWHPLHSNADERKRWQQRLCDKQIVQPFRQAFREIGYSLDSHSFAGYWLSLSPLTALARKEGWYLQYGGLERRFGAYRVVLTLNANLYPGVQGEGKTGDITVYDRYSSPVSLNALAPILANEILRAIDLLVSVTALDASEPDIAQDAPLRVSGVINSRKTFLSIQFAEAIAHGQLTLQARHAAAGKQAIHLATAIETCNGEVISAPTLPPLNSDAIMAHIIAVIEKWLAPGV